MLSSSSTASAAPAAPARPSARPARNAPDKNYEVRFPAHAVPENLVVPPEQAALVPRPQDINKKKYATSVDPRYFLTLYQYSINDQWIMWDYHIGYVHITGLWKAIGNSKADIVKLIDNSPELEPLIRRVRGGFLKIQGTWLPFDVAKVLAARTCYNIRYALVPVFGPDFPDACLRPHDPGFGQLKMRQNPARPASRRRRQSANTKRPDTNATATGTTAPASLSSPSVPSPVQPSPLKRAAGAADSLLDPAPKRHLPAHTTAPQQQHLGGSAARPGAAPLLPPSPPNFAPHQAHDQHQHQHQHHQGGAPPPTPPLGKQLLPPSAYTGAVTRRDSMSSSAPSMVSDDDEGGYRHASFSSAHSAPSGGLGPNSSLPTSPYAASTTTTALSTAAIAANRLPMTPPPPIPRKLVFADDVGLAASPSDFVQVLQATRSLQLLAGGGSPELVFGGGNGETPLALGGSFECAGKMWTWDGRERLDMVGEATAAADDSELVSPATPAAKMTISNLLS